MESYPIIESFRIEGHPELGTEYSHESGAVVGIQLLPDDDSKFSVGTPIRIERVDGTLTDSWVAETKRFSKEHLLIFVRGLDVNLAPKGASLRPLDPLQG